MTDKLKEFTTLIGKAISQTIDKENTDEVSGKLMELSALQGTATYALALAQMVRNEKMAALITESKYAGLSATDKKMVFNGQAKLELYYCDLCEAQLKAIHYAIESMRSILSFMKSERENAKYQPA